MSKNAADMCRICLEGDSDINIFQTTALNDLVANLLIDCADVDVTFDDKLPHVICSNCLEILTASCELRKQIRSSDIVLRELFENNKSETGETKKENLQFSLTDDEKYTALPTSVSKPDSPALQIFDNNHRPPNEKSEAETPTPSTANNSVHEDHSYTDQDNNPEDCLIEAGSDDEEMAEWLKYPEQMSLDQSDVAENVHNCCMCENVFTDIEQLTQHALDVHNKQYQTASTYPRSTLRRCFDCKICAKKFNTENLLKKHQTAHQMRMPCEICGKMNLASNVFNHAKRHDMELVECEMCNKNFKKIYINEHKKKVHYNTKPWVCPMCNKAFGVKYHLQRHMLLHDPDYKRPVIGTCPECGREFDSKWKLKFHMDIHTGVKRFACNYCEARYRHHTDFKRHIWTHEGSPYSCKKCNKYMDRPSQVRIHEASGCGAVASTRLRKPQEEEEEEEVVSILEQRSSSPSESLSGVSFLSVEFLTE